MSQGQPNQTVARTMRAAGSQTPGVKKPRGASELVALVEKARNALTQGDLTAARILSDAAYQKAKAGVSHANAVRAAHGLRDKANHMQGDAMRICALVDIAIADAIDAGQKAGQINAQGRPKEKAIAAEKVHAGDLYSLDDLGVDKRRLQEARKLRDAEQREPGLVERAIQVRLEHGFAPTRSSIRQAVGTKTATKEERGDNLYETPREALEALLLVERFDRAALGLEDGDPDPVIFEPACGRGAISTVLEEHGFDVAICDLRDRGVVTRHGECQQVADFFDTRRGAPFSPVASNVIITNPPYGEAMDRFIRHALEAHVPRKMALLVNLNVLAGFENADRRFWRETMPPTRAHVLIRRLPMMHRDGWDGPVASSQMNTMWLVWDAAAPDATADKPWGQTTRLHYLDWKERAHVGDSTRKTSDHEKNQDGPLAGSEGATAPSSEE